MKIVQLFFMPKLTACREVSRRLRTEVQNHQDIRLGDNRIGQIAAEFLFV